MSKIKGVIFDLDGVIVDTAKFHFLAWRKLANELGIDFTEIQNEELKGVSRVRSLEKILAWGNTKLSKEEFNEKMAVKNENYLSYLTNLNSEDILPGVSRVIDFLVENNIPIALGSASKNARPILEKTGLIGKFQAIVDGIDVSIAKPDPEVFITAARKIEIPQEKCLVFEDSVAGVQAANKAGMLSIGIGDKAVLHEADHVFSSFEEIEIEFIKKLMIL